MTTYSLTTVAGLPVDRHTPRNWRKPRKVARLEQAECS